MTHSERVWWCTKALAATLLLASPAAADGAAPDPKPSFDEGRELVRGGRYAEALLKFEESYRIKPTSGALLNIADCHEKLGHYASAVAAFDRVIGLAREGGNAERVQVAEQRKVALAPLVSHVTVTSSDLAVHVTLDGEPLHLEDARPVDGGEHVVAVSAPCRETREVRVTVGLRADEKRVAVEAGPRVDGPGCAAPPPAPPRAAPTTTTEASRPEGSGRRTLALVLGGAGVVALGAGVGFGLSAASKQDTLEGACGAYPTGCPRARQSELDATYSDASRAAAYSTVGLVSGAVLAGVAVVLYLTAPQPKHASTTALHTPH